MGVFTQQAFHKQWPRLFQEMGEFLSQGLSEIEALKLLQLHAPSPWQPSLQQLQGFLSTGEAFTASLRNLNLPFPFYVYPLLEAGEYTHALAHVMQQSAMLATDLRTFQKSLWEKGRYPLFLLLLAVGVFGVYQNFLLPQMIEFQQSLTEAPFDSPLIQGFPLVFTALIFAACALCYQYGLRVREHYRWHLFFSYLHLLNQSGIPLYQALLLLKNSETISPMEHKFLSAWIHQLKAGASISRIPHTSRFVPLWKQIVGHAESSNTLPQAFAFLATYHKRRVHQQLNDVLRSIQPLGFLLVGSVLCIIVLGFYLPLYEQIFLALDA